MSVGVSTAKNTFFYQNTYRTGQKILIHFSIANNSANNGLIFIQKCLKGFAYTSTRVTNPLVCTEGKDTDSYVNTLPNNHDGPSHVTSYVIVVVVVSSNSYSTVTDKFLSYVVMFVPK